MGWVRTRIGVRENYTVSELAVYLGVSRSTVYRLIKSKQVVGVRGPWRWLITAKSVRLYERRMMEKTND